MNNVLFVKAVFVHSHAFCMTANVRLMKRAGCAPFASPWACAPQRGHEGTRVFLCLRRRTLTRRATLPRMCMRSFMRCARAALRLSTVAACVGGTHTVCGHTHSPADGVNACARVHNVYFKCHTRSIADHGISDMFAHTLARRCVSNVHHL
jgi:hypothetical protein